MSDAALLERIEELEAGSVNQAVVDVFFLLFGTVCILLMQAGFAMVEVGSVDLKNTKTILVKNIGDATLGAIAWWLIGYGVAYGKSSSNSFGTSNFAFNASANLGNDGSALEYADFIFEWSFAATATTIVSGALAERVSVCAYIIYATFLTALFYPIIVHWAWNDDGWASFQNEDPFLGCGLIDISGTTVVHVTGGVYALLAAIIAGPRTGRFSPVGGPVKMNQQSPALNTLGVLIMWAGWLMFNAGGVGNFSSRTMLAARAFMNTAVAPASATLTCMMLVRYREGKFDTYKTNNGLLSGLVAITGSCAIVRPEGAFVIGVIAGAFYYMMSIVLIHFKIDDVVEASIVHGAAGIWGNIATGLFATRSYSEELLGRGECCGVLYGCRGNQLGMQVVFLLVQIPFLIVTGLVLFFGLKYTVGFRVAPSVEESGMDRTRHGRGRVRRGSASSNASEIAANRAATAVIGGGTKA